MAKLWWLFGFSCLLLIAPVAAAEPAVAVRAQLNRTKITVGDLVEYELQVTTPNGFKSELPAMPTKMFGEWEVRDCAPLTETSIADGLRQGWRCQLTNWDVGIHAFPTQLVKITNPDGTTGRANTQPVSVEVASVLDENPEDIKPLKPQLIMNEQANYLLIIGLSLLAILLAGFAAWAITYYRKHRPVPVPAQAPQPIRDPFAVAMAELERIGGLRLIDQGRIVEHYALIADVLRTFITDRFSVPALERTTNEVRLALSHPSMQQRRDLLLRLLAESDGVKFARQLPNPIEAHAMIDNARQAILATR